MMSELDIRTCSWDGSCQDGYAEGSGELDVYENDTLIFHFKGTLQKGKYVKECEYFYPNGTYRKSYCDTITHKAGATYIKNEDGTIFIGEFDACISGNGAYTMIDTDGNKYEGWFEKSIFANVNNPSIINSIYYTNGTIFKGITKNDGYYFLQSGVVYYPNGDSLVLGMVANSIDNINKGTYYFKNGNMISFNSRDKYYNNTISEYSGIAQLKDRSTVIVLEKKQEFYFGWRTYPNGTRYIGCMKNLEPFYLGMIMNPDGTSKIAYFDGINSRSNLPNKISIAEKGYINAIDHFDYLKLFLQIMKESKNPFFDVLITLQKIKDDKKFTHQLEDSLVSLTTHSGFDFNTYKNYYFFKYPLDTTGFIQAIDFEYCFDVYKKQTEGYILELVSQNNNRFFELLIAAQKEGSSSCLLEYLIGLTGKSNFSISDFELYYKLKYPTNTTGFSKILANLYFKNKGFYSMHKYYYLKTKDNEVRHIFNNQIREYFFNNKLQNSNYYSTLNDDIFSDSISGMLIDMRKDLNNMKMDGIPEKINFAKQLTTNFKDQDLRLQYDYLIHIFHSDFYFENYQFEESEKLLIEIYPFKNDHFIIGGRLLRIYALMNMYAAGDTILTSFRKTYWIDFNGIPEFIVLQNFESLSGFMYFLKQKDLSFIGLDRYILYPEPTNGEMTTNFNIYTIKNLLLSMELDNNRRDDSKFVRRVSNVCQAELGVYHPLSIVALENVIFYNGGNYAPDATYSPEECQQLLDTTLQMLLDYYPMYSEQLQKSLFKRAMYASTSAETKKCFDLYFQSKQAQIDNVFPHLSSYSKRMYFSKYQKQAQGFYAKCYTFSHAGNNPYSSTSEYEDPEPIKIDFQFLGDFYNEVIRNKGFLLGNEIALKRKIVASKDTTLISDYKKLIALKNAFSRYTLFSPEELTLNNISIDQIEKEINEKEQLLEQHVGMNSMSPMIKATWKDIQKKLKGGQAAIEIVKADSGTDFLYYVLYMDAKTKDHPVVLYLKDSIYTEKHIYAFYRNSITARLKDTLSYSIMWNRIDSLLTSRKIKTLYFSPDGIYHLMNVQTFLSKDAYIADKYKVVYLNNTKEILDSKQQSSNTRIALFGNPDYSALGEEVIQQNWESAPTRSFQGALQDATFTPLPGTAVEIKNICENFQSRNISATILEEDSATESNFKKTTNVSILHVATHGFFMPSTSGSFDAMLYSGIALAGANNAYRNTNGENGIVTAYEVKDMDLEGTSMVVLSACETGLGENAGFEGVYGLKRALQIAGAHYVISSLWKVDDHTTQLLMSYFYKNLGEGKTIHQAFLLAQNMVRKEYPHPYYWGAFVITGY